MTRPHRHAGILAAADRATGPLDCFSRVSAGLRRLMPFDAAVWSATDPETGLVTAPMLVENLGSGEGCGAYWESELLEENVLPFRDLARAPVPVAGLRAATGDLPARSARFRRLLGGQGIDDELRAVLRVGGRPWGSVSLFRLRGAPAFGADDVALLAELSEPLADRLRRFAAPYEPAGGSGKSAPGLLLFDENGAATSINEEARAHLASLPDGPSTPSALGLPLPIWLVGTALQARAIAQGRDRGNARIRLRTRDGRWLSCRASSLSGSGGRPGPVVLVIEPATPADLALIVAQSYGLTPREFEIAQLVAQGLATSEIAEALFISPHTVRGHLKAVFGKAEVSSRGELVARLFAGGPAPRPAKVS
ncbi:Transcriptional regulator, LuxR family [[Actinomadura] parvosata subsp. kistnae]|uniref:Helix-turn-helix transcriptional regulator n=1 Tax=[Actinomadura] parvosata subsp. kistnae TaxID=1909395 RepID=A0A1U9ZQQ4_9ACTN|nr:helix-turn-helix transcriptional regulator [Nonomuraea sp. ATCC 55076]AQZ60267.1 helix-turn-helix transcriptional regulator [Nonomuraea sp. ATCC 55076]SPL91243.1 Transcriptional regulator, LuxR family [Actinomadura parvosata subsp. kistnae]